MNEIEVTSGRLTALGRLLVFLSKNPGIDSQVAIELLVRTRQIQSFEIASDAESLAFRLGLIGGQDSHRKLTNSGSSIVLGNEDELGMALQRRLLLKIISTVRRDLLWITFAKPNELQSQLPSLHQILTELKLLERNPAEEAAEFWNDLRMAEIRLNEAFLKKIGDQAESWSVFFEKARLIAAGLPHLETQIVWVSRESDLHGYDLLSFEGTGEHPEFRRHIEVKRARCSSSEKLSFHLTRNEFNQAIAHGERYFFHLWWSGYPDSDVNLSVFNGSSIVEKAPIDRDAENLWLECTVSVSIADASETIFGAAQVTADS